MCFFFKQKTAYEMRISDWSSDVCSSDLIGLLIGQAPLGVLVGDDPVELFAEADAVIDFTTPAATRRHAALAAQAEVVYVVGTTGLTPADQVVIDQAAIQTVVVQAANLSLGVNLLQLVTEQVARALDPTSEQRRRGKEWVST